MRPNLMILSGLSALMMACGSSPTPAGTPTSATVNGYTFADKTGGKVNLSVSALDANKTVLASGTITDTAVSGLTVAATAPTGTASICGQIQGGSGNLKAALVLDSTGSMSITDPATGGDFTTTQRNKAAKSFVARMGSSDAAAVASFDTSTTATTPYLAIKLQQDFSSDKTLLNTGVNNATFEGGTTPLWDAVFDAADLAGKQSGSNKIALVMTDGGDNSSTKTVTDAINEAKAKGVRVYMIGLGTAIIPADMQTVATQTGGLYAASDAGQLTDLFNGVFNATQGAGCVQLVFSPVPSAGQKVSGTVSFKVNGVSLSSAFEVQF